MLIKPAIRVIILGIVIALIVAPLIGWVGGKFAILATENTSNEYIQPLMPYIVFCLSAGAIGFGLLGICWGKAAEKRRGLSFIIGLYAAAGVLLSAKAFLLSTPLNWTVCIVITVIASVITEEFAFSGLE